MSENQNFDDVATLEEVEEASLFKAAGPSGKKYLLRPFNIGRDALAGEDLPDNLRVAALQGKEFDELIKSADLAEAEAYRLELRDYNDTLVRKLVVKPDLTNADFKKFPVVDYEWLLEVATGEIVADGFGNPFYGQEVEPLAAAASFREGDGSGESGGSTSGVGAPATAA